MGGHYSLGLIMISHPGVRTEQFDRGDVLGQFLPGPQLRPGQSWAGGDHCPDSKDYWDYTRHHSHTKYLQMVTLMGSVNSSLPKISYMKALDVSTKSRSNI